MSMLPTPPSPLSPMMAALEGREYTNHQLPTLQQQPSTCQQQQSPASVNRRYAPRRSLKSQSAEHLPTRIEQLKPPSPTSKPRSSSFDTSQNKQPHKAIRRRSSFCPQSLHATILFLDLEGYSKSSDIHQRQITSDFMTTLRNLLIFIYNGIIPERGNIDNYVILPTGDGAAVIVIKCPCCVIENTDNCSEEHHSNSDNEEGGECSHEGEGDAFNCTSNSRRRSSNSTSSEKKGIYCKHCHTTSLQTTEETALWIGSTLLLWATQRQIGLRVGLNSGELSIVEDPYGDPNVCGDAINMAARIMDTALPGQILASASTVVPNLNDLQSMNTSFDELDVGRGEDIGLSMDELDIGRTIKPRRRRERIKQLDDCIYCPRMKYEISQKPSEVVVKHGVTTNVQSITCALHPLPRPEDLPPELQEGTEPPIIPSPSLVESESLEEDTNELSSQLHPHPMLKMKNNPKKMSFASLSSLQQGGSARSLRGSIRESMRDSSSDNKPGSNSTWNISDFNHNSGGGAGAQTRMSMLSQLSNVSNDESDIAESMRTANTSNMSPQSIQHRKQLSQQSQQSSTPFQVGNHKTPATKWYMKIKPTEMQSSGESGQIKPKVLPQELIRRHQRIAFLGIMHDNLSKGFVNILESNQNHRWEQVYIFFPSDECLRNHLAKNYRDQSVEQLIYNKKECRKTLLKLLSPVVDDLRFLQYDQLMHCGSYWDWKDPGGFIHISPLTWGANPKTCPAMNYYWNSRVPSPEYRVYREGLGYLLDTDTAKPFDDTADSLEDAIHEEEREHSSSSIEEQT